MAISATGLTPSAPRSRVDSRPRAHSLAARATIDPAPGCTPSVLRCRPANLIRFIPAEEELSFLALPVRAGLASAFAQLASDPDAAGAVLICAGRTFIAGADITEFGKPPLAPFLLDVLAAQQPEHSGSFLAWDGRPIPW